MTHVQVYLVIEHGKVFVFGHICDTFSALTDGDDFDYVDSESSVHVPLC